MAAKTAAPAKKSRVVKQNADVRGSIKPSADQDALRRQKKAQQRSNRIKGLSDTAQDPNVGAVAAARKAAWAKKQHALQIAHNREVFAFVASAHPWVNDLHGTANRAAQKFFEFYSKSPVGDRENPCPRKWAEAKVWALLSAEDREHPKAVTFGIVRAKKALDESIELSVMVSA
ncbi:MAG: hypothetical protein WAW60_01390 [Candidatus Saccharimonadales bacterium]